jgi:hypothetical protein
VGGDDGKVGFGEAGICGCKCFSGMGYVVCVVAGAYFRSG